MSSQVDRKLAVFAAIAEIRRELESREVRPPKYPSVTLSSEDSALKSGYAWLVLGMTWGAAYPRLYMLEQSMRDLKSWEHHDGDDGE